MFRAILQFIKIGAHPDKIMESGAQNKHRKQQSEVNVGLA